VKFKRLALGSLVGAGLLASIGTVSANAAEPDIGGVTVTVNEPCPDGYSTLARVGTNPVIRVCFKL
jgi:hypothetical protein